MDTVKLPDEGQRSFLAASATAGAVSLLPVQLATMQKLAQYWANEHDWRKCEAKINAVPNFITEIDGLDIHFIHVRSKHENALRDGLDDFYKNGLGYANEMALRPQTLYGIVDSPVGLAGWILDHDIRSYQMIARVFDGKPEGPSRDDVLDNITLYWLTNTAISSARLCWDTKHNLPAGGFFDARGVRLPVGVSAFAEEIYQAPKS